jgi:hypothetical protein
VVRRERWSNSSPEIMKRPSERVAEGGEGEGWRRRKAWHEERRVGKRFSSRREERRDTRWLSYIALHLENSWRVVRCGEVGHEERVGGGREGWAPAGRA